MLNSTPAIVYHTLVVYYHAHCSIAYLACLLTLVGGIVITCDSKIIKCYIGHGRGWDMGGKEKWGVGEGK